MKITNIYFILVIDHICPQSVSFYRLFTVPFEILAQGPLIVTNPFYNVWGRWA